MESVVQRRVRLGANQRVRLRQDGLQTRLQRRYNGTFGLHQSDSKLADKLFGVGVATEKTGDYLTLAKPQTQPTLLVADGVGYSRRSLQIVYGNNRCQRLYAPRPQIRQTAKRQYRDKIGLISIANQFITQSDIGCRFWQY